MTHRWALDTEFLEDGKTIELISIALVNLDTDEEYYAGNITCDLGRVKADPWLAAHVVRHLPPCPSEFWRSRQTIARDLNALFGIAGGNVGHVTPEIWADYASYDWVALCQIYGRMIDLPKGWVDKCREFLEYFKPRLKEYDTLLTYNPIFMDRTKTVGLISARDAVDWGLSGPNLRGSGVGYDVRKFEPYCLYDKVKFEVPLGKDGSCWDRYYCRVREMAERGAIPGGTRRNLESLGAAVTYGAGVDEVTKLMLADAQTSGGLLIAVPQSKALALVAALQKEGTPVAVVIGRVVAGQAGTIAVA